MNIFRSSLPLIVLGLMATPASAQEYLGFPDYATWKASTYVVPHAQLSTATSPQKATPALEQRGGAATCNCWVEPDASYTTINNNSDWNASGFNSSDDGSYGPINLPFSFYLYGQYWSTAYININGNVSFGDYFGTFSSTGFPVNGFTMVAPFWADVDLGGACAGCNIVQYKVTPTAMYVNWTNVGYYSSQTNLLNTFQLIITDGTDPVIANGANVSFCYGDMQWTTGAASGGVGGFGGTAASVGANQGNGIDYIQFGRFDHAGTDYDGPYGASDGVSFLDDQYFSFLTDVTLANVPPVITGQSVCDTLVLCVNETSLLQISFISPEPDQITVPDVSAPTLSNLNVLSAIPGLTAEISVEITPTAADVGYHTITFTGTDNGTPVATSVLNVVLLVQSAADMEPGAGAVCDNGTPIDMYTLIGGVPTPGGDWFDPDGVAHSGTFTPGTDQDGIYLYEIGAGGNCPNTAEVTMTTTTHPDAGVDVPETAYCDNAPAADLFALLGANAQNTGFWTVPGGGAFNGTLDPASGPEGQFYYTVNGTGPCPNDTAFITVRIEEAVDPGGDASITLCIDATPLTMLNALNGSPDDTGLWTAPGGVASDGFFSAATEPTGIYTYSVSAVLPCPTLSSTLTISVDPLPVAGEDAALAICADGSTTQLFPLLGGDPDVGGLWLDPTGAQHDGILDPALEVSGDYLYVVNGPNTCQHLTDTALVLVDVNPLPVVTFTAEPDSGCHPLEVTFTNSTDPIYLGGSCVWDLGDGSADLDACESLTHLYEEPGWYNVNLTVTTPEGCTDHLIVQGAVLVEPAPEARFSWTPELGTLGATTMLFFAEDPHATVFDWDIAGTATSNQRQVTHTFPDIFSGEYEVCLNVADRYGCTDSLCQVVTVTIPLLYVPNAFSPNGDGWNEVFLPVVSGMVEGEHELMIFDRWGQLVFSTPDAAQGWDGRQKGTALPGGVYTWRLIERPVGSSDKKDWFGTITLLK